MRKRFAGLVAAVCLAVGVVAVVAVSSAESVNVAFPCGTTPGFCPHNW